MRPPHPLALFSLVPYNNNEPARRAVAHPANAHLVSTSPHGEGLEVGVHINGSTSKTLAILGRAPPSNIILDGASISARQCSFEIDFETGIVMIYDRSRGRTTQVSGGRFAPLVNDESERKVVVQEEFNDILEMGGKRHEIYQFKLLWHQDPTKMGEVCKIYGDVARFRVEDPRFIWTEVEVPFVEASTQQTRIHTPGPRQRKITYLPGTDLGSGQFGRVHKAIDVYSGKVMAVKKILKTTTEERSMYYAVKREIETLSRLSHPHIIDYIGSQGWELDEPEMEIFMGLKEGNLQSLIVERGADFHAFAPVVLRQMLQALDFLAWNDIIHRDVKPENILYTTQPDGQYLFQLGDFGLCNRTVDAFSHVGTELFKAPEMFQAVKQTPKVDVWALFVTMVWVLDVAGFRQRVPTFRNVAEVQQAVLSAASMPSVSDICEMARADPARRASAAQMLVERCNGDGLSTPRNRVPALDVNPPAGAPATLASQTLRTSRARPRRRPLGLLPNPFAAHPYRAGKRRDLLRIRPYRRPTER
ncbi:hypothetical protein E4U55_001637 [Claviceps digitariae]|nr:hypothetical protein E4U55_001637 [Claviceps digitariae]